MCGKKTVSAAEALELLRAGNREFIGAGRPLGDVSSEVRARTCREGQTPYAVVITCSDSRVIPEAIFSAGIGDIFVIRSAGNVIGDHELGSTEYAVSHLGCPLVLVLGHTNCGAVDAAIHNGGHGFVKCITDEIGRAIGCETDPTRASVLNVQRAVEVLRRSLGCGENGPEFVGALYHIDTGKVEFI